MRERLEWLVDGCILGIIVVFFIIMLLSNYGCATTACPPCVAEVETVVVKVPVESCPEPPDIPALSYPSWPEIPTEYTDEGLKRFYADVVAVIAAREKIFLDRIRVLGEILDGYRD